LKKNQKYVSVHGKIMFIKCKSTLNLNWCWIFEPFKAQHEFCHIVPINHARRAYMFQMIPRINRKYLS
jgi:hypothetical protein